MNSPRSSKRSELGGHRFGEDRIGHEKDHVVRQMHAFSLLVFSGVTPPSEDRS